MSNASEKMKKKGIISVTDNIKVKEQLNIPAGIFIAFFGQLLTDHYSTPPSNNNSNNEGNS